MTARITARAIDATAPAFGLAPDELIVDSFAGGGGASEGIRLALGIDPHIAINHDAEALAMHEANHPGSRHYREDVWKVDPVAACAGRPVGLMWLSPDCKHFSKAKGGKPVSKQIRGLAWMAVRWAAAVRPRLIILENVEEFQTWGPVSRETGRPCPARKGLTFRRFVGRLRRLGYAVEWRELRACDFGAPTIRRRLFLIARCDGQPIRWPEPTHGKGRPQPWRTAAECIDWTIPCPSIFLTAEEGKTIGAKRPLAPATLRRIARGVQRYVLDSPRPFIVGLGGRMGQSPERPVDAPYQTITAKADAAVVAPVLTKYHAAKRDGDDRAHRVDEPLATLDTSNRCGLVAPHLITLTHQGGDRANSVEEPVRTITGAQRGEQALVASLLVKLRGTSQDGQPVDEPAPTLTAQGTHVAEVRAFLTAYYSAAGDNGQGADEPLRTVTARDRLGLVTVHGQDYVIVDIGMRMLTPRELFNAQGFRPDYRIDVRHNGRPITKTAQVRMVGNSVCPPLARALVAANVLGEGLERAPLQGDFFAAEAAD